LNLRANKGHLRLRQFHFENEIEFQFQNQLKQCNSSRALWSMI
jgi:hypothetical protein